MRESVKVMQFVFIALAAVAFVAGFFLRDTQPGGDRRTNPQASLVTLDQYTRPLDPALIGYEETAALPIRLQNPTALGVAPDGQLYVAGPAELLIFGDSDTPARRVSLARPATCLTLAPNGQLYAGTLDQIHILDMTGTPLKTLDTPVAGAHLTSLAATESDLYVADAGNRVIYQYTLAGEFVQRIGERNPDQGRTGFVIPGPFFDVAIGSQGLLWAVNPGLLALESYRRDGELRSSWARVSVDVDGFCGCCNPTHIATLPDGGFVTAEKGIVRVKIHEPTGELRTVVAGPDQFERDVVLADLAVDAAGRILVLDPSIPAVRMFVIKP